MGANLFIFKPEQKLHKKLIRIGFEDYGDPDLLSHTLLHSIPLQIAIAYKIPLVLLGENPAFEYVGDDSVDGIKISREWFLRYACADGITARVISEKYKISYDEKLKIYDYPNGIDGWFFEAIFASYFFKWDSEEHLKIAKQYGFKELEKRKIGTYKNFIGLDEHINFVHQYMKVLKFGYGRASDHVAEDIRNGRLTKEEGKDLIKKYDLESIPKESVDAFCEYLDYSKKQFFGILEKYRNEKIWKKDNNDEWIIDGWLEE